MQGDIRLIADYPAIVAGRAWRNVEEGAGAELWMVPSSMAAVAQPVRTRPTCSTLQREAPTAGPTCLDHCQPGWYVARPMVMGPRWTSSNFPFSKVRISSGDSKRLRIISRVGCIFLPRDLVMRQRPGVF